MNTSRADAIARAGDMPTDRSLHMIDDLFTIEDPITENLSVEDMYANMLQLSTGGTRVLSLKAPAMSTEFVKSRYSNKALAKVDGAFIAIDFPSVSDVEAKNTQKHGTREDRLFGYVTTAEADAFPAGYGERAANSLVREDNVYQLKSTFSSAALAMSKLRARTAARQGDADAIVSLFAKFWGLSFEEASLVPELEVKGSEKTRMAALEDRAYHALTCHPAYAGGFRVDLASVTQDALGADIPLNWARVRTGAKALALLQLQGDLELRCARNLNLHNEARKLFMEVTYKSQPPYERPYPWESLVTRALEMRRDIGEESDAPEADMASAMRKTYHESQAEVLAQTLGKDVFEGWDEISSFVRHKSKAALEKAVVMMEIHHQGRALLQEDEEEEMKEYAESSMGRNYLVPEYLITKRSITSVLRRQIVGRSNLPDITSHGPGKTLFDFAAVRHAGLARNMTVGGALNLAVFITTMKSTNYQYAYALMRLAKDPEPGGPGKVAIRLREPRFFEAKEIRALGKYLFDESFVSLLESIIRNLVSQDGSLGEGFMQEIWLYLSSRYKRVKQCPVSGGISELMEYLIDAPEGWSLYYWARVSIGKWQYASSNGILAPIAAGEEVDLIKSFKKSVRERAAHWVGFYKSQYKDLYEKLQKAKEGEKKEREIAKRQEKEDESGIRRYIPPHLRDKQDLREYYEDHSDKPQGKAEAMSKEDFERLTMAQVKKKFFENIDVRSCNRVVSVGITDSGMREMMIESYQARWLSLDRRLERAKERNEKFTLGGVVVTEHPWGELLTSFPENLEEVRHLMRCLQPIGWTVDPDMVWDKLSHSISLFWGDLSNELKQVVDLLEEKDFEMTDEQAYANLSSRTRHIGDTHDKVATIPAFGYVPPYKMPEKQTTITLDNTKRVVEYASSSTRVEVEEGEMTAEECLDWVDEDEDDSTFSMEKILGAQHGRMRISETLHTRSQESEDVLTYREIAYELGLGELNDFEVVRAFCLDKHETPDTKHVDLNRGPIVRTYERDRVRGMWRGRLDTIKRRLGLQVKKEEVIDM